MRQRADFIVRGLLGFWLPPLVGIAVLLTIILLVDEVGR